MFNWIKKLFVNEKAEEVKEEEPLPPPDKIVLDILNWVKSIDPVVNDDYYCEKEYKRIWNPKWERREETASYEFYDKSNKGFRVESEYRGPGRWSVSVSYYTLATIFKIVDGEKESVSLDKMIDLHNNKGNTPFIKEIYECLYNLYPQSRSYKQKIEEEARKKVIEQNIDTEIFELFSKES